MWLSHKFSPGISRECWNLEVGLVNWEKALVLFTEDSVLYSTGMCWGIAVCQGTVTEILRSLCCHYTRQADYLLDQHSQTASFFLGFRPWVIVLKWCVFNYSPCSTLKTQSRTRCVFGLH